MLAARRIEYGVGEEVGNTGVMLRKFNIYNIK